MKNKYLNHGGDKMKKLKGGLGILIGLGVIVAGLGVWQKENIAAVLKVQKYSEEEIALQIDGQKESVNAALKSYGIEGIKDFSVEEEEEIRSGKLTVEEAMQKMDKQLQDATSGERQDATKSSKIIVEEAAAKMYGLKAKYIGKLGDLERQAKEEYRELMKGSQKSGIVRQLIPKYMKEVIALENECNTEVNTVLATLTSQLEEIGEPTDIVGTMKAAYEQEKTLKKAYYLSLVK